VNFSSLGTRLPTFLLLRIPVFPLPGPNSLCLFFDRQWGNPPPPLSHCRHRVCYKLFFFSATVGPIGASGPLPPICSLFPVKVVTLERLTFPPAGTFSHMFLLLLSFLTFLDACAPEENPPFSCKGFCLRFRVIPSVEISSTARLSLTRTPLYLSVFCSPYRPEQSTIAGTLGQSPFPITLLRPLGFSQRLPKS